MQQLHIHAVETTEDGGLAITYGRLRRDVRKNGLMWQHTVVVPAGSDYDDELEAVGEALQSLLEDVLEDQKTAEEIDLTEPEEEDDDDE